MGGSTGRGKKAQDKLSTKKNIVIDDPATRAAKERQKQRRRIARALMVGGTRRSRVGRTSRVLSRRAEGCGARRPNRCAFGHHTHRHTLNETFATIWHEYVHMI